MVEQKPTNWIDWISIAISRVAMFVVPFITAIMFYEVVLRYLFARPTLWVNELSLWLAGAVYLLAGLYVMQQRGHIRISILYDIVPRGVQRLFDLLSTLFICLFAAAIVYGGSEEAWDKLMRWDTYGTAWDPPIPATMKPLVLIAVVLIAAQAVANLISDWSKERKEHDLVEEVSQEFVD